jgi:N-acetylmuramic acid 6-phosphate etherase
VRHPSARVASPTELVNARTTAIDDVPVPELLRMLSDEDRLVPQAVAAVLPNLASLVEEAVKRVSAGGRVHYFGAGTSGRLGVLDAAELMPTFGVMPDEVVVAHLAGGNAAIQQAVEDAEDAAEGADAADVTSADVVIGLAASGRTPYVRGALNAGRAAGAATALITSNPNAPLAGLADFLLAADTGPEAITGSTRLKAGTAQKMILNMFSTALMVRLGHTYGNLMIDMLATNAKLRGRSIEMLVHATAASDQDCVRALDVCGDRKTALVYLLAVGHSGHRPVTPELCRDALHESGGRARRALDALMSQS